MSRSETQRVRSDRSGRTGARISLAWVLIYLAGLLALASGLRLLVWGLAGGSGTAGAISGWLSDPFVYVFNKSLGLPVFSLGGGKVELGTIVALLLYAAIAAGIWLALARGWSPTGALPGRGPARRGDGGK